MTQYSVEQKDSFTVLGIGTELKSDYTDYEGISKEKSEFWDNVHENGDIEKLKSVATNDYLFIANEAVNNKMMHYAGVMTEESLPEATRAIEFPESDYLVVKGEAETEKALSELLTGSAFGEVVPQLNDVAYQGGPNAAVIMGKQEDNYYGEMWIPVVKQS
ncbi:GyrI-like domain-containing protein [Staphylococcus sp. Marseille-Q5304]|uniref:GyrI-like domain-containing protein n=1 Tax=Staphylococcus sp. Marseille-Q5304 TaxID=2942200 RepID=UPI0020739FE6|nr:GyrI-like domain-containing protein [Staphylococcus sp. Marseille-Q5304]